MDQEIFVQSRNGLASRENGRERLKRNSLVERFEVERKNAFERFLKSASSSGKNGFVGVTQIAEIIFVTRDANFVRLKKVFE